jgi:hypothetical protein
MQVQPNDPVVFAHVALPLQLSVAVAHSSMSVHVAAAPALLAHEYALGAPQPPLSVRHSSMSAHVGTAPTWFVQV